MIHGDISNHIGYTIAFRCEDCLFKPKEGRFIDRILNKLQGKFERADLNEEYLKAMEHLYRNTEYTVDVVIMEDNYTPSVKKLLENLPFNRVIKIRNESAVTLRINTGDISVYVDEDTYRLSLVNSKYAVPLKKLNTLLKGRF